jgi:aminomethyltransferase
VRTSPLHDAHVALGAKLTPFGGWEMPLSYPSGTVAEHMACRQSAVAFDVSHLGTVRIAGEGGFERLQGMLTNDLGKISAGRTQYTHLCDDDGSVLDDIIVWWVAETVFDVMPNASNTDGVIAAIGGEDTTGERAVIAVQGPKARERVAAVSPEAAAVVRRTVVRVAWDGIPLTVAGTGYTGEDGVELAVPAEYATKLWDALLAAGVIPAGLGARDTLRLEAGLPLHGHELGPGITPLQAGLGWVVGWKKPAFRGKAALEAERDAGPRRLLRGFATQGRRPLRAEQDVLVGGDVVGRLTSGNFSPVLGHGIGLGFVPREVSEGTPVEIDARGTMIPGAVVSIPFVAKAD